MIINVQGLKKSYKKQLVLKNITFQVEEPQIIALIGPNGSGKTTMMNCLMNLLPFQEGEITILGKKHTDPSLFYEVSYLQDNRVLYGDLTGADHLNFICHAQKLPARKAKEVAAYVGMDKYAKKRVRSYSLGMKQHLLLAMAILNEPKLILLDEPINGLDPTSAIHMRHILMDLHAKGSTIIISSHNLEEIDKMTNTIYFMKDGEILEESLEKLNIAHYSIYVSNSERARDIFTTNKLPVTMEADHFIFSEADLALQQVIDTLNENDVKIRHIENKKIGAEKRYMELFESELRK
ncbi:ABC transporter ATP-binding protein [Metasolibacillus sp. FSL H7-0170]|uniref:ABC transporter ATP-binding protein n=1 Tax=Metasolibacillus sp. FSL H7-0170 TaxID=2921431 RepID=UPI00315983D2